MLHFTLEHDYSLSIIVACFFIEQIVSVHTYSWSSAKCVSGQPVHARESAFSLAWY